jgi:arylsulfatase A-like enzyme
VGVTASSHVCSLFNYDRGFDQFYENPEYRPEATNTDSLPVTARIKQAAFDTVRNVPVAKDVGEAALDAWRSFLEGDDPSCPFERADTITDRAIELLEHEQETHPDEQRFVWIGYMEPHGPYLPPESVLETADTLGFTLQDVNKLWERWFDNRPELGTDGSSLFTPEERETLKRFYHLQARYLDGELRRLHEYIDEQLGYEDTLLLFTADHGEEFFEHGDLGHRPKLIDELLHVPLIAYSEEDAETGDYERLVSHVDLGPTVATALGVEPHKQWAGRVVGPIVSEDTERREHVLAEICHTEGYGGDVRLDEAVHATYTDEWKYVRNERTGNASFYRREEAGVVEIEESVAPADRLREIIAARRASLSDRAVDQEDLSEEVRDRLHRLGYVGE